MALPAGSFRLFLDRKLPPRVLAEETGIHHQRVYSLRAGHVTPNGHEIGKIAAACCEPYDSVALAFRDIASSRLDRFIAENRASTASA
jgi:hypothetical protein